MSIFKKIIDAFLRFKMCLNCPLDHDECGRTNKIINDGNCVKIERKEE